MSQGRIRKNKLYDQDIHIYGKIVMQNQIKIKSSLYSSYCAEACNELRGPSPRLSAWATQLRRNVATVASRWRHCADLTGPGIQPQTSRTDSVRFATELTADAANKINRYEFEEACTRFAQNMSAHAKLSGCEQCNRFLSTTLWKCVIDAKGPRMLIRLAITGLD